MKKRICSFLLLMTLVLTMVFGHTGLSKVAVDEVKAATRELEVPVEMWKAYEEQYSMANDAVVHTARVLEQDGWAYVTVTFQSLDLMGQHGNLTNVFSYPPGTTAADVQSGSAQFFEAEYNTFESDLDIDMETREFPRDVTFIRETTGENEFFIRVWVNAMDGLKDGTPGSGAQNARIRLDYANAKVISENADAAPVEKKEKPKADEKKSEEKAPENKDAKEMPADLKDGRYKIKIDLWHAQEDRESMGNKSMNHEAIIERKDGKNTLFMSVHPMGVSDIVASVETIEYKDENGKMQYAEVIERRIAGDKPSAFKMPLLTTGEYTDVMVNPKVMVMGNKPVPARIRLYWDTLREIGPDEKLDDNIEIAYNTAPTPEADMKDEATGVRVHAPERTVPEGASIKVEEVTSGEMFDKVKATYENDKIKLYDIKILNKSGDAIQPLGPVDVYLPIPDGWNKEKVVMSHHDDKDGTRARLSGEVDGDSMKVPVNHFSLYALNEEGGGAFPIGWIIGIIALLTIIICVIIVKVVGKKKPAKATDKTVAGKQSDDTKEDVEKKVSEDDEASKEKKEETNAEK
ncbi:MAG: NEAT domain-containing protein [Eubacteriales bacterium]|nr:NEAT domain-containing protein [Eubacteriales bacterium]